MKKQEIKRMFRKWTDKRLSCFSNNKAASDFVAVVVLIIIVLVVGAVVFLPGLLAYIRDTVMPGITQATSNLFNFGG
jgi:hypothetical protein